MDYESFFNLSERPFIGSATGNFFYQSGQARNFFTLVNSQSYNGIIYLKGPKFSGKTSILKHLYSEVNSSVQVVLILNPDFKLLEILKQCLKTFGLSHKYNSDTPEEVLLGYFHNAVSDLLEENNSIILAVDNADKLSQEAINDIYDLTKIDPSWENKFQLIMAGLAEQQWPIPNNALENPTIFNFNALTKEELKDYITTRLKAAGLIKNCFNAGAMSAIFEHSQGLPGKINPLAERSLIAAWAENKKEVNSSHVLKAKNNLEKPLKLTDNLRKKPLDKKPEKNIQKIYKNLEHRKKSKKYLVLPILIILCLVSGVGYFWSSKYKNATNNTFLEITEEQQWQNKPDAPIQSATPAAPINNEAPEIPELPTPPTRLLSLPHGAWTLVIDQDLKIGRLWQGGTRGAGLKAEITGTFFEEPGLYIIGKPNKKNFFAFQYPNDNQNLLEATKELWPKVSSILPQNFLPVIVAPSDNLFKPIQADLLNIINAQLKIWVQAQEFHHPDTLGALYNSSFEFFENSNLPKVIKKEEFVAALKSEFTNAGETKLVTSEPLILVDPKKDNLVWAIFHLKYQSKLRNDTGIRVLIFERGLLSRNNWSITADLWLREKSIQN